MSKYNEFKDEKDIARGSTVADVENLRASQANKEAPTQKEDDSSKSSGIFDGFSSKL